jgi:hypothetical protein
MVYIINKILSSLNVIFLYLIMPYILEVQQFFINGHNTHPEWNGTKENIGYINKIFNTKQEASDYY